MASSFVVWAGGDAHVGTDLRHGRRSLADALTQSEGGDPDSPAFEWDIMIDVGDLSGSQTPPDDEEGREVLAQYGALRDHDRGQIYNIVGNHDASGPDEPDPQWWFRKYVDPMGENTATSGVDPASRPYPTVGQWDRYKIEVGNLVFLLMGDRNDGGPPVGRGERGGYPAGAVTGETFDWWVEQVEANRDRVIVTVHHHMLKATTTGSGPWEGFQIDDTTGEPLRDARGRLMSHYHGYFPDGGPMGSGYLYWVDGNPDAQAFERYLAQHPGCIDLWFGGHTHTFPEDRKRGRSLCERKWGVTFLNCAALTKHHGNPGVPIPPSSRVLTFTDGGANVKVEWYMHTSDHVPQGFHTSMERVAPLKRPFEW